MSKNLTARKTKEAMMAQVKKNDARLLKKSSIKKHSKKPSVKKVHYEEKKEEKEEKKIKPRKIIRPKIQEETGIKEFSLKTQVKRAFTALTKAEVECLMLVKEEEMQIKLHQAFMQLKSIIDLERNDKKEEIEKDEEPENLDEDLADE